MKKKLSFLVFTIVAFSYIFMFGGLPTNAEDVPIPSMKSQVPSVPIPSIPSVVPTVSLPSQKVPYPSVSIPQVSMSVPQFPSNRMPNVSYFPSTPARPSILPSGMTPSNWADIPAQDFEWMNWWQINVSYQMKTHDESMFYRELQVGANDIPAILSLLDYKGIFYPVAQKIAIRILEKVESDGIDYLRKIARGEYDGKGNLHPTVSPHKLPGLAAYALGLIRADESFNDIAPLLTSSRPEVRMLAVLALGHLGSERSEARIMQMLPNERDQRVASAAMIALSLFGTENARRSLIEQIESGPRNPIRQGFSYLALAMLMKRPSNADIVKAIYSSDCATWLAGLAARCAQLYEEEATANDVNKLIEIALMHCDGTTTITALMPLYLLHEKLALGDIKQLLENRDPEVRAFVRFLAAMSNSPDLAKLVVGTEVDPDERAAKLQSLAIAYLTAPDRVSFARGILNNERDKLARVCAMLAMGEGIERADISKLKAIASVAGGQDLESALLFALYQASKDFTGAWNDLVNSTKSSNQYTKNLSMVLIGATKSSRAARLLLDMHSSEAGKLPYSIALSLLGPLPYEFILRNALEAKGDIPRASAILAYSFLPLESARATLFERLESETTTMARSHAAIGLLQYKEDDLTPKQIRALINASSRGTDDWIRSYSTFVLGKFARHDEINKALASQLSNPNVNIRAMAALGAGVFNVNGLQPNILEMVEKERTYAILAQITSLGLFKNAMMFPYFSGGIRVSASDPERLAFATALSASIPPEEITTIVEKLSSVRSTDVKTYAWTLGLHNYPDAFLARKVVNALRSVTPEKDETTRFHIALVRCALGDGIAAKDLLDAASAKGFYFDPVLPEPRFLLEYFQSDLPDYSKVVPYFYNE